MGNKSPVDVRELGKMGILGRERFFQLLSEQNNYTDPEATKDFYMGLVRHVTKELKKNGIVRLPYMGDFFLLKQKPALRWMGKVRVMTAGTYTLKFRPNDTWRRYFNKLQKYLSGKEASFDPRERLLNKTLE